MNTPGLTPPGFWKLLNLSQMLGMTLCQWEQQTPMGVVCGVRSKAGVGTIVNEATPRASFQQHISISLFVVACMGRPCFSCFQSQVGWGFEQPDLVEDVPAHGSSVGTR